jgi:hypothetical protein
MYYDGSTDGGLTFTRTGILASGLSAARNRIGAMVIDNIPYAVIWEEKSPRDTISFYYWNGSDFVKDNSMNLNLESNNPNTRAYSFTQTDDGNVHVAYWDNSVGSRVRHVYKKRTDVSWTGPLIITSDCNLDCQIGITAHGNDVYAGYRGGINGTFNYNKFSGGSWQGEVVVDSNADIRHPAFPKKVPATSNFIPVAWVRNSDLFYYAIPTTATACTDFDGDHYNATAGGACGTVADCNDNNNSVWQYLTGYPDSDLDSYYSVNGIPICSGGSLPSGYSSTLGNDCNDSNSNIHPGAIEICGNGIDEDCSGADLVCSGKSPDVNNDGKVNIIDLAINVYWQSKNNGQSDWGFFSHLDLNNDGVINFNDVRTLMSYI